VIPWRSYVLSLPLQEEFHASTYSYRILTNLVCKKSKQQLKQFRLFEKIRVSLDLKIPRQTLSSIFVHLHICMYVHLYICTYVHLHICMSVYLHICMYVHLHICKFVQLYIYIYLYLSISIYIYLYIYFCMYVHLYICMTVPLSIFISVYLAVSITTSLSVFASASLPFICLSICLYVYRFNRLLICLPVSFCLTGYIPV
jgi:hypothetical protein